MVGEVEIGTASDKLVKDKISEDVAEDHARLLGMVGQCLAEIGFRSSLTTFHNLVLYGEEFHLSSRYEPELDVFWADEDRPGIALRVKLTQRGGKPFYCWGVSWAQSHPANDPVVGNWRGAGTANALRGARCTLIRLGSAKRRN